MLRRPPLLRSLFRAVSSSSTNVRNHIVTLTVVDGEGVRHTVKGIEGEYLHDVIAADDDLRDAVMIAAPHGRGAWDTHLYVTKEVMQSLPAVTSTEMEDLNTIGEDVSVNSRMASRIQLKKEYDGAVVALGGVKPWMTM